MKRIRKKKRNNQYDQSGLSPNRDQSSAINERNSQISAKHPEKKKSIVGAPEGQQRLLTNTANNESDLNEDEYDEENGDTINNSCQNER